MSWPQASGQRKSIRRVTFPLGQPRKKLFQRPGNHSIAPKGDEKGGGGCIAPPPFPSPTPTHRPKRQVFPAAQRAVRPSRDAGGPWAPRVTWNETVAWSVPCKDSEAASRQEPGVKNRKLRASPPSSQCPQARSRKVAGLLKRPRGHRTWKGLLGLSRWFSVFNSWGN